MIFGEHGSGEVLLPTAWQAGLDPGVIVNDVPLGIPLSRMSISPDPVFATQNTGLGHIRVLWPGQARRGQVDLSFEGVTRDELALIEFLFGQRRTLHTFVYAGQLYRTRFFKLGVDQDDPQGLYATVRVEFSAQLPGTLPTPGFGTTLVPDLRFTQVGDYLRDAFDTAQGTLVRTEGSDWWLLKPGGQLVEVGHYAVDTPAVAERDAHTTVVYGWGGSDLYVATLRGDRLRHVTTLDVPFPWQDARYGANEVELLRADATGLQVRRLPVSHAMTAPDWYRPGQTHFAFGPNLRGSFQAGGVLVQGAATDLSAGLPLYHSAGTDKALNLHALAGQVLLSTETAGVIAQSHATAQQGGVTVLDPAIRTRHLSPDPLPSTQAGVFAGPSLSPYQVTAGGLSVAQLGFPETFRYPGVIKVLGRRLLTRHGLYRSVT